MAVRENFTQTEMRKIKMEPPEAETPVSETLVESLGSPSPGHPQQDQGTAGDGAVARINEERDEGETLCLPPIASEGRKASTSSALSFPQKLWLLVESDQLKTIWWSHGGNYFIIDEEPFKVEVLGMNGPSKPLQTQNMTSFLHQVNLYGFTKTPRDFRKPPPLPEFLAEGQAFTAHTKLLVCYRPCFKRDHPELLERCKRRVAPKRRAVAAPALQGDLTESRQRSSPGAQPMQGAAAGQERSGRAAEKRAGTQALAPPKSPRRATTQAPAAPPPHQPPAPSQLPPNSHQTWGPLLLFHETAQAAHRSSSSPGTHQHHGSGLLGPCLSLPYPFKQPRWQHPH